MMIYKDIGLTNDLQIDDLDQVKINRGAVMSLIKKKQIDNLVVSMGGRFYNSVGAELEKYGKLSKLRMDQLKSSFVWSLSDKEYDELFCPF